MILHIVYWAVSWNQNENVKNYIEGKKSRILGSHGGEYEDGCLLS
jgi:spore germination protein GerM